MNKKRNLNIEILRIIGMLMIVILHFQLHGGVIKSLNSASLINNYPVFLIESICIIAVNIYVLITGYYMTEQEAKPKRIKNIVLRTLLYSIAIGCILMVFKQVPFNLKNVIKTILPITTGQYWFINAYIILLLLSPYLNKLIANITEKEHRNLLIILLVINSIIPIYLKNNVALNTGNSVFWFINLYLIAAYLKKYPKDFKKFNLLITTIISILISAFLATICYNKFDFNTAMHIYKYNLIFALIPSVTIFMIATNSKKTYSNIISKIITFLSSSTLAVYLISDNSLLRNILWNNIIITNKYTNTYIYPIYILITSIIIFLICILIDKIVTPIINQISK